MKVPTKIISILVEIAALYGLYMSRIVNGQSAIMIALMTVVLILVVGDLEATLQNQIQTIGKTVGNICRYIITKDNLQAGYFTTDSPIILTLLAERVLRESGAQKIINNSLSDLIAQIGVRNPRMNLISGISLFPLRKSWHRLTSLGW